MRAALSITFLLAYLSICTGPVFPFLEYWLDYDIIVAEKCENVNRPAMECNGKCYLTKELAKASQDNSSQEDSSEEVDVRPIEVHDRCEFDFSWIEVPDLFKNCSFDYKDFLPIEMISEWLEPPEM